ncbi:MULTISPECIES: TraX family protein [Vagococcus]|uniref:Conserved membrane protein n=1 Tax=Vagococcus fluvialis bH819 TaxID=1255619 RepID=A0A1X6WQH1_9ENTE|nr:MULTISPECIES: TraX family protein [Vagococcus]SLM86517.1 Conserved membrane protein [Vagococcus fluvialis bH819]HCM90724.1 hypothetical protein [Vagococcus sp.]
MNQQKFGITGTQLKFIGIVLMVFDHVHQMFNYAGVPLWFGMLGRLVLPVFLFMAAEGFYYTRDRKKYMLRLLIGFWMMNILSLIFERTFPMENVQLINNVFGTLLLATMMMSMIDSLKEKKILKALIMVILPTISTILFLLFFSTNPMLAVYTSMIFPSFITVEGGFLVVILGAVLYLFREKRYLQYLAILLVGLISTGFNFTNLLSGNHQWMMIFSIFLIALYNGQRGKGSKYFFYIFYPAHIYILYILSYLYTNFFN